MSTPSKTWAERNVPTILAIVRRTAEALGRGEADAAQPERVRVLASGGLDAPVNDGWENTVTGLGTYERDKAMHARFERPLALSYDYEQMSALYHNDDISGRIVDLIPDHMFRRGWETKIKGDTTREKSDKFDRYGKNLGMHDKLKFGTAMGRNYGGAIVILGADDGRTVDQPLDETNIKTVSYLNQYDRRFIIADSYYGDPLAPKFSMPMVYKVFNDIIDPKTTPMDRNLVLVHESRVLRFEGANTDPVERRHLAGWTHSVLQRPYEKIKAFAQAFQAAGNIMTDASQGVYKLEGLMGQVAGNELQTLTTRMMMMDMGRSVARSIILDKDGEEFERTIAAISGYPEMLDRFMMLLSAATEIPVTLLMGRSAAGMNATGDSDFRQFYSVIESMQTHKLEPMLQRLYRLFSLAKDGPTAGAEAEFTFKFRSLWQPTAKEQAEINFTQAQADSLNVQMGAVTGEEVALSRFGEDGETNLTTTIDHEGRREAQTKGVSFDPYSNDPGPEAGAQAGELALKQQGAIAPAEEAPQQAVHRAPTPKATVA